MRGIDREIWRETIFININIIDIMLIKTIWLCKITEYERHLNMQKQFQSCLLLYFYIIIHLSSWENGNTKKQLLLSMHNCMDNLALCLIFVVFVSSSLFVAHEHLKQCKYIVWWISCSGWTVQEESYMVAFQKQ